MGDRVDCGWSGRQGKGPPEAWNGRILARALNHPTSPTLPLAGPLSEAGKGSKITSAPGWGPEWSVGALGVVGEGLSHGEEVVRPEWDGEEGSVLTFTAQVLPATPSSALASKPRDG